MPRGPVFNTLDKRFTTRDSLGIEGVATSISAEICPVVNTVTPRAFYWPFMVWIYYDFYRYSGIEERSYTAFDSYLKRQDYFFVLSVLLTPGSDQENLVGKQQSQLDLDTNAAGPYPYNPKYFKTRFGGMQYYNAGCISMGYIIDQDPETQKYYSLPKLTKEGEKMALAFENKIKDTAYYREYRRNDKAVPRDVLIEYGHVINIGLKGFNDCKSLLKHSLFERKQNKKLSQSAELVKYLYEKYQVKTLSRESCRQLLFDHLTPSGNKVTLPEHLHTIANEWGVVIARQYFTSGLEMIWKYMLSRLSRPLTIEQWIKIVLESSVFTWNMEVSLLEVVGACNYDYATRERMVYDAARGRNESSSIEKGLKIILSIYNWMTNKEDFGEEKALLSYGVDSDSIALTELLDVVVKHKELPVRDLLFYIMKNWLIDQHYTTAFEKMLQGRDGFYYEIVDGFFVKKHDFDIDFQGIRLIQLMRVMKDVDML